MTTFRKLAEQLPTTFLRDDDSTFGLTLEGEDGEYFLSLPPEVTQLIIQEWVKRMGGDEGDYAPIFFDVKENRNVIILRKDKMKELFDTLEPYKRDFH